MELKNIRQTKSSKVFKKGTEIADFYNEKNEYKGTYPTSDYKKCVDLFGEKEAKKITWERYSFLTSKTVIELRNEL